MAKRSKLPGITLLNGIFTLVITEEELASSGGLGLERKKDSLNKPVLDPVKIEAIQGNINLKRRCSNYI